MKTGPPEPNIGCNAPKPVLGTTLRLTDSALEPDGELLLMFTRRMGACVALSRNDMDG